MLNKLLHPFTGEQFILTTTFSEAEVRELLQSNMQPFPNPGILRSRQKVYRKFQGGMTGNSFKLKKATPYGNSFSPILYGTVTETSSGSQIEIKSKIHGGVLIFISIWLGIAFFILMGTLWTELKADTVDFGNLLHAFLFFGFGLGIIFYGYYLDAPKLKRELIEVLKATERERRRF